MALTPQEQGRIFRYLEPKYRKAYEEGNLNDDDLREWAVAAGVLGPDFSGVSGEASSTANPTQARQEPEGFNILNVLSNANPSIINPESLGVVTAVASDPAARAVMAESAKSGILGAASAAQNIKSKLDSDLGQGSAYLSDEEKAAEELFYRDVGERNRRSLDNLRGLTGEAEEATQEAMSRVQPGVGYEATETVSDILASPESFLSVLGPGGATLAVAGQFGRTLDQANAAGLEGGKAVGYAALKTVPSALEFLPGRVGAPLKRNVDDLVDSLFMNTLKRGGAEGFTEVAQSAAEMTIDKTLATYSDDPEIREYAQNQLPESTAQMWDNLWRSLKAGGVAGGALSLPGEAMRVVADAGKRAGTSAAAREATNARSAALDSMPSAEITPTVPETPSGMTREEEIEAAYAQREPDPAAERQRNAELQRQSLANRVDTSRQAVEVLQDAVNSGDTSQATLNAFSRANRELRTAEELYNNQVARMQPAEPAVQAEEVAEVAAPVVETVEAAPEVDPAVEAARNDARKIIEKDSKAVRQKATTRRNAERRKFIRAQNQQLADLPEAERIDAVANALVGWDNTNPVENFITAPKAPKATPAQQAQDTAPETAPVDTADRINQLRARMRGQETPTDLRTQETDEPMAQQATATTGVSTDAVFDTFDRDITSREAGRFTGLLEDGNLEVVRTQTDLPEGDLLPQGAGFYDPRSGKTIVVADKLNPENIKGDVMSILAHEVKHAADRGGFTPTRGSLKNIIGEENNQRTVSQIEKLAQQNTPMGQATASMLEQVRANYPESAWAEEIPANFINLAMAERTGPGRALVSAIRTRYKEMTGNNDLNLNDVKYLADQLVREAAQTEAPFRGEAEGAGRPLPMIVGTRHPNFDKLREEGRTYTGPDGNERAVLTDVGSRINLDELTTRVLQSGRDVPIPLSRMLQHEELYSAYPQLESINVIVDQSLDQGHAYYHEGNNIIALSPGSIAELLQGDRGKAAVRGSLLHEIQHAIQGYEGNARGGSPEQFLTNTDRILINRYERANRDLLELVQGTLSNPDSIDGLENGTVSDLRQIGEIFKNNINDGVIGDVIDALREDGSRIANTRVKEIQKADQKVKEMMPQVEATRAASEKKYYDLYGEIEAYWTEKTRNLPQDQLPIDPGSATETRGFRGTNTQRTDTPLVSLPGSGVTPVSASLGTSAETVARNFEWAQEYFGNNNTARNFANWFRDSKVVDENGNPHVMYHGTRTDVEFSTFIPGENEAGIHVGTSAQANDPAFVGAIYTTDPEKNSLSRRDAWRNGLRPRVIPLFVRIENPLRLEQDIFGMDSASNLLDTVVEAARNDGAPVDVIQNAQKYWNLIGRNPEDITFDDVRGMAQQLGYDGFVYRNENEGVARDFTMDESSRLFNPTAAPQAEDSYVVFNSNQLKSATANSGEFDNTKLDTLASIPLQNILPERTNKVGYDQKEQSQIERAVKRLLVPGGGFGSQLNEILRHAENLPAALAIEGTYLGNQFRDAMARVAVDRGVDEATMREEISKKIEGIDALESRTERISATNALERQYPGVGKALRAIRDYKLGLTDEIMALRLRDPKPLSEKEEAMFVKMADNAERYTTRAYLATYDREVGKQYVDNLLRAHKQDPDSEQGQIVSSAIDYLINNELLVPDRDTLNTLPMRQLRRMYDAWVGNVEAFEGKGNRQVFINALSSMEPKSRQEMEDRAMEIVRELLGANKQKGSLAKRLSPSLRQNRTILETRSDMPEPLRKLMGEITDPLLRETISLHRMINLSAKTKALTEIFEQGREQGWISDKRTPRFDTQLNNVAYGPLDGMWISQDTSDAITGMVLGMNHMDSALSDMARDPDAISKLVAGAVIPGMHRIMSIQKTWNVVASMTNMLYNLGGAIVVGAPTQGIFNPATIVKGMKDTATTLALDITDKNASRQRTDLAKELIAAGVTDSATMGEFRSKEFQSIIKEINKIAANNKAPGLALAQAVWKGATAQGKTANALRTAYAFMDVWNKVATYQDRKAFLTKFNEAEGNGWTDEQIQRRAGYEAAGTNISYERSIPLARITERNIPVAMFLTYFSEVPRALTMSYMQVVRDFKMASEATTPQGRNAAAGMAMSRLIGTTAATAGVIAGTLAVLDNEDDEEKQKRKTDAPWMRNAILVPVGLDKDGNEMFFSLNRFDPWGPLNELVIEIAHTPDDQKAQVAAAGIGNLFVQSKGVMAVGKTLIDAVAHGAAAATGTVPPDPKPLRRNKNTMLERNYPAVYNFLREAGAAGDLGENLIEVAESMFIPAPVMTNLDEARHAATVRETDLPYAARTMELTGGKPYIRNADRSLFFRVLDHKDVVKAANNELKDKLQTAQYRDPAAMAEIFVELSQMERRSFEELSEVYEGYMAFDGKTHATALEAIGTRDKKLAQQLRYGRFKPTVVTADKLKDWYDDARKEAKGSEEKKELTARYKLMRQVLIESKENDNG